MIKYLFLHPPQTLDHPSFPGGVSFGRRGRLRGSCLGWTLHHFLLLARPGCSLPPSFPLEVRRGLRGKGETAGGNLGWSFRPFSQLGWMNFNSGWLAANESETTLTWVYSNRAKLKRHIIIRYQCFDRDKPFLLNSGRLAFSSQEGMGYGSTDTTSKSGTWRTKPNPGAARNLPMMELCRSFPLLWDTPKRV